MGFEEFEPIFGEPKIEWAKNSDMGSSPLGPFLMRAFAPDDNHLKIQVTDYHSNTFEAFKSVMQLEDMRDSIGIGGSWSEFIEYIVASIKSEDIKLILEKNSDPDGVGYAKLVAQKSKAMPLISFSLTKIVDSVASDAMASMSFGLFKALKFMQSLAAQEQEHSLYLSKVIPADKGNENIQSQLGKRQKSEKMNSLDTADVSAPLASNGLQDSPDKQAARDPASTKKSKRVVPAYRRAKVRGALLQDTEDDKDN